MLKVRSVLSLSSHKRLDLNLVLLAPLVSNDWVSLKTNVAAVTSINILERKNCYFFQGIKKLNLSSFKKTFWGENPNSLFGRLVFLEKKVFERLHF